jgi:hypothetical protein
MLNNSVTTRAPNEEDCRKNGNKPGEKNIFCKKV